MKEKITRSASSKRVRELISLAEKAGLLRLKVGEVEFEFGTKPRTASVIDKPSNPIETVSERIPTDEEFLDWSSPHYDALHAQKS